MASTTILASAAVDALERTRLAAARQLELDCYEAFRSIKDNYEEAVRPSVDDVESVLSVLAGVLSVNAGQREYQAVSAFEGQQFIYSAADRLAPQRTSLQRPIHMAGQGLTEGRTWYLRLSPGVMGLRCADENKKERAQERQKQRERKEADLLASGCNACPLFALTVSGAAVGEIREWSARSRVRMSELVGSLDYSEWTQDDGALAMVTLTLPGKWQAVAPDGKTFKKQIKRFEMRWRRNIGPWRCLWKLEFQGRGAPHWHGLLRVPALVGRLKFEEWLSQAWADCVKAPFPNFEYIKHLKAGTGVDFSGKDFSDPRRISLYFLGHSSKTTDGKEYQHAVPKEWQEPGKGPGRFWGNPGLESASREIEITERDAVQAARILRKVKRARAWKVAVLRERGNLPLGKRHEHKTFSTEVRRNAGRKQGRAARQTAQRKAWFQAQETGRDWVQKPRFVGSSLGSGGYAVGGWVLVNDGLQLGLDFARYIELRHAGAVL